MARKAGSLVVVFALLAIGAVALGAWLATSDESGEIVVTRADLPLVLEASGKLEAAVAYEIGPPSVPNTWNYNLTWMVPEGQWVKKGSPIARFDSTDIDEQIRDYSAQLETVKQQREKEERNLEVKLRELRLDLVKAENDLAKVNLDLGLAKELVSAIEFQKTRLRKELAEKKQRLLAEKIEVEQELVASRLEVMDVKRGYYEGKLAQLQAVKDKYAVKAPIDGLVVYIPKRNGDRWEVGESVWMLAKIMSVADVSTLRVEAAILEVDAARVEPGQEAEVAVDAVPGMVLETSVGEIGSIVRERSIQDRGKILDAFLPLVEFDRDLLRPGMGVSVTIVSETLEDQLVIPLDAVRNSPEGPYVMLEGGSRRSVELGQRSGGSVVVLAGLEEGERIAMPGAGDQV